MGEDRDRPDRADALIAAMMGGSGPIGEEGRLLSGLPHSREIGMRLLAAGQGAATLAVPWREDLVGDPETGVLHGDVVTALRGTACGIAVMATGAGLIAAATLDLRIDYMRPATRGAELRARAECYRLTRAIGFARAVAFHADPADPVASAAGAFSLTRSS